MGPAPATAVRPSAPEPLSESAAPEYVPDTPAPPPDPHSEAPPWVPAEDFDPYTHPIPGFDGDPRWLDGTNLGLAEPWADLVRLSVEGADRNDPRVVSAGGRLKKRWDDYGETFEERTANGPYAKQQAAIWRAEIEEWLRTL